MRPIKIDLFRERDSRRVRHRLPSFLTLHYTKSPAGVPLQFLLFFFFLVSPETFHADHCDLHL